MVRSEIYFKVEQIRFANSLDVSRGRGETGVGKVRKEENQKAKEKRKDIPI